MTDAALDRRSELDRNLALLNYGLLFSSIFFAGIPALIAVIIAYTQRGEASPDVRTHHDFQIRIFWVAFLLTMVAAACGLGALIIGVSELIKFAMAGGFDALDEMSIGLADIRIDASVVILSVITIVLSLMTAIWLIAAPAFGFIRLASERSIGDRAV